MAELIYQQIIKKIKKQIFAQEFADMKLPDERSLAEHYRVSRSTIKRALNHMAQEGIIFKKRGSGTFINPLYLKNNTVFNYDSSSNLGITDSFQHNGQKPKIKVLDFKVIPATKELQQDLFLEEGEFVYEIIRLRLFDETAFMIETGYIPIKLLPGLKKADLSHSIFNLVEKDLKQAVTKSFMSVYAEPSNQKDQELLKLAPTEPIGVMEGIFFLDNGTPFEFSKMRLHYRYMKYNSFVTVN